MYSQQPAGEAITVSGLRDYFDQQYGPDHNLVNGLNYAVKRNIRSGHPYLGENRFYKGTVEVRGTAYHEVDLKYDIALQELVLNSENASGIGSLIKLHKAFIDEFSIDGRQFRRLDQGNAVNRYYQVIEAGKLSCCVYYTKTMREEYWLNEAWVSFNETKRRTYLFSEGTFYPFRNRRSFTRFFPEEHRKAIRRYLRTERLSPGTASDEQIYQLLSYCSDLMDRRR